MTRTTTASLNSDADSCLALPGALWFDLLRTILSLNKCINVYCRQLYALAQQLNPDL